MYSYGSEDDTGHFASFFNIEDSQHLDKDGYGLIFVGLRNNSNKDKPNTYSTPISGFERERHYGVKSIAVESAVIDNIHFFDDEQMEYHCEFIQQRYYDNKLVWVHNFCYKFVASEAYIGLQGEFPVGPRFDEYTLITRESFIIESAKAATSGEPYFAHRDQDVSVRRYFDLPYG